MSLSSQAPTPPFLPAHQQPRCEIDILELSSPPVQIIAANNDTCAAYVNLKRFTLEVTSLKCAEQIAPGSCALFMFNVELKQLHGFYLSTSLYWDPVGGWGREGGGRKCEMVGEGGRD